MRDISMVRPIMSNNSNAKIVAMIVMEPRSPFRSCVSFVSLKTIVFNSPFTLRPVLSEPDSHQFNFGVRQLVGALECLPKRDKSPHSKESPRLKGLCLKQVAP